MTAMFLTALAAGCDRQKEGEEAVAWVNGEPIRFSVFWDEIKNRYNEVTEASSPQQDVLLVLKRKVLSDLIRERLLLQEASRRGITVPDEALEARVEELRAGYTGSPLRKSLIKHAMDYDQWRRALRENMVMEALFAHVVQDAGKVTDQEVGQYYRNHLDEFLIPEAVELNQIVVKSRSTAQRLLRRIRKRGRLRGPGREVLDRTGEGTVGKARHLSREGNCPFPWKRPPFRRPRAR